MAEEARPPTRKELEAFCPDKRTVRAFELLFEQVKDIEERLQAAEQTIATEHP